MERELTIIDEYLAREQDPFLKEALIFISNLKIKNIHYNPVSINYRWNSLILVNFDIKNILFHISFSKYKQTYNIVGEEIKSDGYKKYLMKEYGNTLKQAKENIKQLIYLMDNEVPIKKIKINFEESYSEFFEF